jgi:hypothetical protein
MWRRRGSVRGAVGDRSDLASWLSGGREDVASASVDVEDGAVDECCFVAGEIETAAAAMSAGVPGLPTGVVDIAAAPEAGTSLGSSDTTPGEMAFTRMPCAPNSAAQVWVRVSRAPFVAP